MSLMPPLDNLMTLVYHSGMKLSSDSTKRWVIQNVELDTVRTAKTLAARHDVSIHDVVDVAVQHLWEWLYDNGELPDGWKEF